MAEWPIALQDVHAGHRVRLRGLRARHDKRAWFDLREDNRDWTRRWDSTSPHPVRPSGSFAAMVRQQDREARAGHLLPFVVDVDEQLSGQMHLFGITRGSLQSGTAGYWVSRRVAGRGVTPFALAMLVDYAFNGVGLHRVEVNVRPENAASLRVVEKLGMREEGVRRQYLHVDGAWRDHRSFALTTEDLGAESARERFRRRDDGGL